MQEVDDLSCERFAAHMSTQICLFSTEFFFFHLFCELKTVFDFLHNKLFMQKSEDLSCGRFAANLSIQICSHHDNIRKKISFLKICMLSGIIFTNIINWQIYNRKEFSICIHKNFLSYKLLLSYDVSYTTNYSCKSLMIFFATDSLQICQLKYVISR